MRASRELQFLPTAATAGRAKNANFRQIVPHQQCLVLVDRKARMLLARRQLEAQAALGDAVFRDQLRDLLIDAQPDVREIHRVDRMRRHRDVDEQSKIARFR